MEEDLTLNSYATEVTKEMAESRFSRGKVCPFCGHSKILKHGIFHGKNSDKQRYKCQNSECKKTFTDYTLSPAYNSKKILKQWLLYSKCMINGYSIRKCAAIVGINIATSFFWRHKLLEALTNYIGIGNVSGVVEDDAIFCTDSHRSYIKFAQNLGIELHQIKSRSHTD